MSDYAYKVFSAIKIMVKWVKLTVINDNKPNPPLLNDWGWSVLIETDKWTLLYDADTESRVMENNVRALGIDLNRVDAAFLSHYHADHYGGFKYVGEVRRGVNGVCSRGR